ncbi:MAG: TonB-dependent receptor, partial [Odoribacter sp.]|nr:TonB-dependent receptor [Odoribacter sp.]
MAALNYAYSSKTYKDMENSRFGLYNSTQDKPDYLYKYTDNQYNSEAKIGGILNLTFIPNTKHKFELRNTLNQIGKNRYTEREGYQYISGLYTQKKAEYIYNSRLTYTGQIAGTHNFSPANELDWTAGISYANKKQPDRRIINWEENSFSSDIYYRQMQIDQNSISRDFMKLNENIYSLAVNYNYKFSFSEEFNPQIKTGIYGEFKDRDYRNREFYYRWYASAFDSDFAYRNVIDEILIDENYGADKLYIYEDTDNRNSYTGKNNLYAAYLGLNIPVSKLNIYAGLRFEHNK